jgi:hypothetical protein
VRKENMDHAMRSKIEYEIEVDLCNKFDALLKDVLLSGKSSSNAMYKDFDNYQLQILIERIPGFVDKQVSDEFLDQCLPVLRSSYRMLKMNNLDSNEEIHRMMMVVVQDYIVDSQEGLVDVMKTLVAKKMFQTYLPKYP